MLEEVEIVNVDWHVGLHDAGLNDEVAPDGNPDAENETDCVVPEVREADIKFVIELPCITALFPSFEIKKSKAWQAGVVTVAVLLFCDSKSLLSTAETWYEYDDDGFTESVVDVVVTCFKKTLFL